jgi:hypothetical protein
MKRAHGLTGARAHGFTAQRLRKRQRYATHRRVMAESTSFLSGALGER